jgi:hypothetical protein
VLPFSQCRDFQRKEQWLFILFISALHSVTLLLLSRFWVSMALVVAAKASQYAAHNMFDDMSIDEVVWDEEQQ